MIKGWNDAGWMSLSTQIGDRIAPLIGAQPGHVIMGDTLSIKVHQALAAALACLPEEMKGKSVGVVVSGGKIVGNRFASIVLPAPGDPIIRMLCAPAAAITKARFAIS